MDLAQVTFSCELKIIVKSEPAVHHSLCDPQFLRLKFNDIFSKERKYWLRKNWSATLGVERGQVVSTKFEEGCGFECEKSLA